jgi:hypothetical protein
MQTTGRAKTRRWGVVKFINVLEDQTPTQSFLYDEPKTTETNFIPPALHVVPSVSGALRSDSDRRP